MLHIGGVLRFIHVHIAEARPQRRQQFRFPPEQAVSHQELIVKIHASPCAVLRLIRLIKRLKIDRFKVNRSDLFPCKQHVLCIGNAHVNRPQKRIVRVFRIREQRKVQRAQHASALRQQLRQRVSLRTAVHF